MMPNKVVIQTLHKSKGQGYKVVFLPDMSGNFDYLGDDD
jgi:ATP-dependent exoDNAse (exonuclease V) beta subunit